MNKQLFGIANVIKSVVRETAVRGQKKGSCPSLQGSRVEQRGFHSKKTFILKLSEWELARPECQGTVEYSWPRKSTYKDFKAAKNLAYLKNKEEDSIAWGSNGEVTTKSQLGGSKSTKSNSLCYEFFQYILRIIESIKLLNLGITGSKELTSKTETGSQIES